MSKEKFLADLRVRFDAVRVDIIEKMRGDIVYRGKHSPKLIQVAYAKGLTRGPKYFDPDNTAETGAIGVDDALLLYALVDVVGPMMALEVGTWFGTSAAAMSLPGQVLVDTCDRNDVYVGDTDRVRYHHCMSTRFLEEVCRKKRKYQFAFIDANLKKPDAPLLRKVLEPDSPIALHDFEGDLKGVRNYQLLRHHFKQLELVRPTELPVTTTNLAVMIPGNWQ